MSIQKLKNRLKGLETELLGVGGRIPKEERILTVQACTEEEAHKGFEQLKAELREKHGDFQEHDVLCFWVKDYSDVEVDEDYLFKCWGGARNVKKSYVGWRKLPLPH